MDESLATNAGSGHAVAATHQGDTLAANKNSPGRGMQPGVVGPVGFEPTTYGLRVRCSTN